MYFAAVSKNKNVTLPKIMSKKHGLICNITCETCVGGNCTNIEKLSAEQFLAVELKALAEENSTEDTDD